MHRTRTGIGVALLVWGLAGVAAAQQPGGGTTGLPTGTTELFAGSGVCARCHEGILEAGLDVSPVTLWRATMMGNSAKDPLWRAQVSSEAAELPGLAAAIEAKCITCHSPMLYRQAEFDGVSYGIADLVGDPLYRDGVNCTVCHQFQPDNFGLPESFSGGFQIDPGKVIYGPYRNPLRQPMINNSGFDPREAYPQSSWEIGDAEHCASCHNLFTHYVDADGNYPSADTFPEQTPYYEWLNSDYSGLGAHARTCQECHMPRTETPLRIATRPRRLQTRSPFWYHEFVGGNAFMLGLLHDNVGTLGLTASEEQLGEKLFATEALLGNGTVGLDVAPNLAGSTLTVAVTVTNLAGHKLPTGIPLRRVWVHLTVTGAGGESFESGEWNQEDGEITDLPAWPEYEPHHDLITEDDQVQIYEAVMQDVDGNPTRTLLLAGAYAKDNRLPPAGFSTTHELYDYIKFVGVDGDTDFNADGGGKDTVTYQVAVDGWVAPYTVAVEVLYQSVTPGEVAHLKAAGTEEAALFDQLYQPAGKAPAILAMKTLSVP